jgi:hypothetical protein
MKLDDPRWEGLEAGYRVPFDPRPLLRELAEPGDHARTWERLFSELYHQGDIGPASYASVPVLVEIECARDAPTWQAYSLVATIELARDQALSNVPPPSWLLEEYRDSIAALGRHAADVITATTDPLVVRALLAVIALSKGRRRVAQLVNEFDDAELEALELPDYGRLFPKRVE